MIRVFQIVRYLLFLLKNKVSSIVKSENVLSGMSAILLSIRFKSLSFFKLTKISLDKSLILFESVEKNVDYVHEENFTILLLKCSSSKDSKS